MHLCPRAPSLEAIAVITEPFLKIHLTLSLLF
nr:MAG TPA: hypothetical protein [Caudoviricetes sp.]